MDFKSFGFLGRVEKKVEISKDLSVTIHSLSTLETQKALAELPSAMNADTAYRGILMQIAFLVYSTSHINDQAVTLDQAKDFYHNLQSPLFNQIYGEFDLLAEPQQQALEELKKK